MAVKLQPAPALGEDADDLGRRPGVPALRGSREGLCHFRIERSEPALRTSSLFGYVASESRELLLRGRKRFDEGVELVTAPAVRGGCLLRGHHERKLSAADNGNDVDVTAWASTPGRLRNEDSLWRERGPLLLRGREGRDEMNVELSAPAFFEGRLRRERRKRLGDGLILNIAGHY